MKLFKVWIELEKDVKAKSRAEAEQYFKDNMDLSEAEINSREIKK